MDGVAIRHGDALAVRLADVLQHLREELHAELRIAAKAQFLAETHDSRRTRKRLFCELPRRHLRQPSEMLQHILRDHLFRGRKIHLLLQFRHQFTDHNILPNNTVRTAITALLCFIVIPRDHFIISNPAIQSDSIPLSPRCHPRNRTKNPPGWLSGQRKK